MSIYNEIDRLELAKQNLKLKLESKGVTVPANARISDYPALINLLPEIKESEFTNRIVDNGNSGTGKAKIYNIKGRTRIWNQYVNAETFTFSECTLTKNANGTYTVSGAGTVARFKALTPNQVGAIGHKLLYRFRILSGAGIAIYDSGNIDAAGGYVTTNKELIYTQGALSLFTLYRSANATADATFSFVVFDLTLMFGAGYEPTTVEEFESLFPLSYYPYNAGTPINNDAEDIESIGFNLVDYYAFPSIIGIGAIEDDVWHTAQTSASVVVWKNNIRYTGQVYITYDVKYASSISSGQRFKIRYKDGSISTIGAAGSDWHTVTGISDANKIVDTIETDYGSTIETWMKNVCFNLSNPAKNGTYEPYKKDTCHLGLNSFRVKDSEDNIITVNGLKSASSVYDEIDLVRNKYIQRLGELDLGNLNYTKTRLDSVDCFEVYCITFPKGLPKYGGYILSTIYSANNALGADKTVAVSRGSNVATQYRWFFRNDSYTDAVSFKAAMQGVKLIYELATPIEYDLVDELDTIYDVDKNGVERIISPVHADGSPSAPFRASIGYPVNQE